MAFPGTLVTLDDFNRADAPDLGANWTVAFAAVAFPIFSNTAGGTGVSDNQIELWSAAIFAANQRVWATLVFPAGQMSVEELVWLLFRCPTPLAQGGYSIELQKIGLTISATLQQIGGGYLDTLETGLTDLLDGDFIGVDVVGGTFTLYHGIDAASAVAVAVFSDSAVDAPGYIGIGYHTNES